MNGIIESAIANCEMLIQEKPFMILSEGDFERLLANCLDSCIKISLNDINYVVHTQISHYANDGADSSVDARVDILVMDERERIKCEKHLKGYIYASASYAFELKYIHNGESIEPVRKDFDKADKLLPQSELYVMVLFDSYDLDHINSVKNMYEQKAKSISHKSKLHYKVMFKRNEEI